MCRGNQTGNAACWMMYAFGRAYGLPYKTATFHSKKGSFNTVYWQKPLNLIMLS